MSVSAVRDPDAACSRREVALIGWLTLVAAGLRFFRFGRLGLTHFDEGIYAFAGLWSVSPRGLAGLDPQLIAYAPPGFAVLVGLAYAVLGVGDASALLVGVVSGVLTIPVAGWVGRRTFGEGAGAASSAFAALAIVHVAYSRKALTDAPFLLAWLVAVGLGGRFLERPRLGRAVAFGLAVGVAQNLKYNGWIAGAVVAFAALSGIVRPEQRRASAVVRTFGLGVVAVLVAGVCYWPWFGFVERHGGYVALIRHHRSYLGGPHAWLPFWKAQLAQGVAMSGGAIWGVLTWQVACVAALAVKGRSWLAERSLGDLLRLKYAFLFGAPVVAMIPDLSWWVGVWLVGPLLADARPARRIVGSWWLVLSAMTPLYHPYARLWLPLHAAGWLMLSGVVVGLGGFSASPGFESGWAKSGRPTRLIGGVGAVLILGLAWGHWGGRFPKAIELSRVFAPTDDLRAAVAELGPEAREPRAVGRGEFVRVRVLGRRPIAYYLALQGGVAVDLLADETGLTGRPPVDGEWALVDETRRAQGKPEISGRSDVLGVWSRAEVWQNRLDPVALLDVNPEAAFDDFEPNPVPLVLLGSRSAGRPPTLMSPPDRGTPR